MINDQLNFFGSNVSGNGGLYPKSVSYSIRENGVIYIAEQYQMKKLTEQVARIEEKIDQLLEQARDRISSHG